MTPAIEIQDLRKLYPSQEKDQTPALDGVSFQVPAGTIYGLLGPNGAGKSTLVKILSTIITPTSGSASVLGFDVVHHALKARQQMVVVLQQTAAELLLTVEDNLITYALLHGMNRAEAKRRIARLVEEFDLSGKLHQTVQELSLGTKRRIQVAKIFLLDSPLIILDEATTGMDPMMKHIVLDRLRAEATKGRTVLLTTQVLSEAEELCDTIMILDKGKTLASGTLPELRKLSEQMFRVSVTFAETGGDFKRYLEILKPVDTKIEGRSVELLFRGEQTALLRTLAEISHVIPITQFEVKGPDLEEIFMALVKGNQS